MKFFNALFISFILLFQVVSASEGSLEWKKPKVPDNRIERNRLESTDKEAIKEKIREDQKNIDAAKTDEEKQKFEAEKELDEKKVDYIDTLISTFDARERLNNNPNDPAAQSTIKNNEAERKILDKEINNLEQRIQTGFKPGGNGNTPQKGPSFFEKFKSTLKSFVERFTKKRIVKEGSVSSSYEEVLNYIKVVEKGLQAPPTIQPKGVDLSKITLTVVRYKEPSNTNIESYAKEQIDTIVADALENHASFAVQNQNDPVAVQENFEATVTPFDFDEQQKKQLETTVETDVKQIESNLKKENPSRIIADFFENKSEDAKNNIKNLADTIQDVLKIIKNSRILTPELVAKLDYIQRTIDQYSNYAQYSFNSLNPLYRTRLLSFLEGSNAHLAQAYSQIIENFGGLKSDHVKEIASKREMALSRLNSASKRLINELEANQDKVKNTLSFKNESQKNNAAKALSQEAQTIAVNLPNLTRDFTTELLKRNEISQADSNYFNGTLLKNLDTFIADAKAADASQKSITFAQVLLDEIINLQAWLKEYSTLTPLDLGQRKKVAEFISMLEQKAGQIRQLWAQNVQNALRAGPNNEPYILPKSIAPVSFTRAELNDIKNDLAVIQDSSFQLPGEKILSDLQADRDAMTGVNASGRF